MGWIETELEERGGAVPFHDFMELALYHPSRGYYTSGAPRAGRSGDFVTAPTASHWYGTVVGGLLARIADLSAPPVLIDVAAADGAFLAAVLDRLGPARLAGAVAVERSSVRRDELSARLGSRGVSVVGSVEQLPRFGGPVVVHASELYDAMPVHRVVVRSGRLFELWVQTTGHGLAWTEAPAPVRLRTYLEGHGVRLVDGQLAELNLAARPEHRALLERAGDEGLAIVLDYGYPARRLYDPRGRAGGSLASYRQHRADRNPLTDPGECDLTAHVNWDDLTGAAADAGWREVGLWPLAELLVRCGLEAEVEARGVGMEAELDARTFAERQDLKRLLDPEGMGADLKALVQAGPKMADLAAELLSR